MASSSFVPYTTPQVDFSTELDLTSLSGKCALLTGAASGLGAATAVALAKAEWEDEELHLFKFIGNKFHRCYVTVVDLNEVGGSAFVQEMEKKHGIKYVQQGF